MFKRRPTLEQLNAQRQGTLVDALGIQITALGDDFIRGSMPCDERTRQPFGLLHGGASVALAETLGSMAGNLCLDNERFLAVGLEISANHLRPVTRGSVHGTARAIHVGKQTQVWDIRIEDDDGRMSCISRLTLAVIPKQ
ncbi:hotdog fold thioesterase [Pseudomarimonas salicorniae]|uniref:Hotdog fold thioesterase n=1 Tax=Pseudomarimonas salicorniae TaxID=2933270 RepID=A0ABT0GCJ2_9GAMM|nr:hotdog fold thioesterase [Lysobacter sp. CAU 1642]MCK7592250.1 hotdog fold thioesterase [Lysobacter sp. CAU 1642]